VGLEEYVMTVGLGLEGCAHLGRRRLCSGSRSGGLGRSNAGGGLGDALCGLDMRELMGSMKRRKGISLLSVVVQGIWKAVSAHVGGVKLWAWSAKAAWSGGDLVQASGARALER
jgi:hypothetical protein